MVISRIEVVFAFPVDLTDGEMRKIDEIANDAARRTETSELVHWAAECDCKPNSVFYIETAARGRYDSEPFEPLQKRETEADRFCELLESIDQRCSAVDGPIAPTLQEATSEELRKLYLFADRIRKAAE